MTRVSTYHRLATFFGFLFLLVGVTMSGWGGSLTLKLEASPDLVARGDFLTYTATITNSGVNTLVDLTFQDPLPTGLDQGSAEYSVDGSGWLPYPVNGLISLGTIAGGATVTIEIRARVEYSASSPLVNTGTTSGLDETGIVVAADVTATVELAVARSSIEVVKEAQDFRGFPVLPSSTLSIGETITYVYTVRNTGEAVLTDISAVDNQLGEISLARDALAPWESTSGTLRKMITEEDLPGSLENTVVVTAIDPDGGMVTDSDTLVPLDIVFESSLELTKATDKKETTVGNTVVYTYTITNLGDVTVHDLELIDDHIGEIPLPTGVLTPGEELAVIATYIVSEADLPGPLVNTARLTGIGPLGKAITAEATASVFVSEAAGENGAAQDRCQGRVIISEVAWAGTLADPDDEWIELCNLGTTPVDLTGWQLCWYPKLPPMPDKSLWKRIELSGTIGPSPIDLCHRPRGRPQITFLKLRQNELSWLVFDMWWWVAGKDNGEGRGYYTLERRHDATVSNVPANLIYDAQPPYHLELPDEGAVILLLNAEGEVVDTVNAEHLPNSGWPAGDARTGATMERSDPLTGDVDANWHTNPGILVCGLDSAGNRLAATFGKPNSPSLEELIFLANAQALPYQAADWIDLDLRLAGREVHPWVRVTTQELNVAGGPGATTPYLSLSGQYTEVGYHYRLVIETTKLLPGSYYAWITGKAGEAILVPIAIVP